MRLAPLMLALAALAPGAPALAAPPANDMRTAPQEVPSLPAQVGGTTVEATLEPDELQTTCGPVKSSVWFSFTGPARREVLLALDAAGDLDAQIDVWNRSRSQLLHVACSRTNRRGEATIDFDAQAGTNYLVRVAAQPNSVEDTFSLRLALPDGPARPPGERLPDGGARGELDRFSDADDAWAVRMQEGGTYRINLVTPGASCVNATLYRPGDFGGAPLATLACDDHEVVGAPRTGTYTIHVRAPRASRGRLPYRLRAGRAGRDDTAPGIPLADDRRVRGSLAGNELDALDLYWFTVAQRSDVRLRLRTNAQLELRLLTNGGRRLGTSGDDLERRLQPGHYFVAVRARDGAAGSYVLSRLARTITRARMLVDGQRRKTVAPGTRVAFSLRVTPAVSGRATLILERYDPLAGWLFQATHRPALAGSAATLPFTPPSAGRWRVTGSFDGTRRASPSLGGTAELRAVVPLERTGGGGGT